MQCHVGVAPGISEREAGMYIFPANLTIDWQDPIRLEMIVSRLRLLVKEQIGIRAISTTSQPTSLNHARWLSETKSRVGKLFFHGTTTEEAKEASGILKDLTKNWRECIAASEGFLTGEKWRGLYRHNVVWGDMVGTAIASPPPRSKNMY